MPGDAEKVVGTKRTTNQVLLRESSESEGESEHETDPLQQNEKLQHVNYFTPEPLEETHRYLTCGVTLDQSHSNHFEDLVQARKSALKRVLHKIPLEATDLERAQVQTLAGNSIRAAGDESDCEMIYATALGAAGPVLLAIDLRQKKEKLRALGLQKLPWNSLDKDRREAARAIDKVLEHMTTNSRDVELRGEIENVIEATRVAIQERAGAECRLRQINSLLPWAKLHAGMFLTELCDQGEIESDALFDWSWRHDLERDLEAYLKEELAGRETIAEVYDLVEDFLIEELEGNDDEG